MSAVTAHRFRQTFRQVILPLIIVAALSSVFASAIIAATNYAVDPLNAAKGPTLEQQAVSALRSGLNVDFYDATINGSEVQRLYAEQQNLPVDVLVLGASRANLIRSTMFPGRTFFNTSMPSSGLPEMIACYEMWVGRGLVRKELIVNLEPFTTRPGGSFRSWSLMPEAAKCIKGWGMPMPGDMIDAGAPVTNAAGGNLQKVQSLQPWSELVSLNNFRQSVRVLARGRPPGFTITTTTSDTGWGKVKHPDGSLSLCPRR